MEDPITMFQVLLNKIKEFGNLAGLYINKNKFKIMCYNLSKERSNWLERDLECEVAQKTKYLWIELTMKNINILKK